MRNILWLVLAGFILGFATSTIWEWYYFRGRRLAREALFAHKPNENSEVPDSQAPTAPVVTAKRVIDDEISSVPLVTDLVYKSEAALLDGEQQVHITKPSLPKDERARKEMKETIASLRAPTAVASPLPSVAEAAEQAGLIASAGETSQPILSTRSAELISFRKGPVQSRYRQQLLNKEQQNDTQLISEHLTPSSEPGAYNQDAYTEVALPSAGTGSVQPQSAQTQSTHTHLTERSNEYPDDLTQISGIGNAFQKRLYEAGIYTWHQVSETDGQTLRQAMNASAKVDLDEIKAVARGLAKESGRMGAIYRGPKPDELGKIRGVSASILRRLHQSGIVTYQTLANATEGELAGIFHDTPTVSREHFAQWIEYAREAYYQ